MAEAENCFAEVRVREARRRAWEAVVTMRAAHAPASRPVPQLVNTTDHEDLNQTRVSLSCPGVCRHFASGGHQDAVHPLQGYVSRMVAIGGYDGNDVRDTSDVFDMNSQAWLDQSAEWDAVAETAKSRTFKAYTDVTGCASVSFDGKIHCVGGYDGKDYKASADSLDYYAAAPQWQPAAKMTAKRAGHALVASGSKLFAIGGYNQEGKYLKSVEYIDLSGSDSAWKPCAEMEEERWGCGAVTLPDGRVIVAGGRNLPGAARYGGGKPPLNSVEVYDPNSDQWSTLPEMPVPRQSFSLCYANGYVYAIGGTTNPMLLHPDRYEGSCSVNRYHVDNQQWEECRSMNVARMGHAATFFSNTIVVSGGSSDGLAALDSVEAFDTRTLQWQHLPDMPTPRWGHSLVMANFGFRYVQRMREVCRHLRDQLSTSYGTNSHNDAAGALQHGILQLIIGLEDGTAITRNSMTSLGSALISTDEYRKSVETMHTGPSTKLVPLAERTRESVFDVDMVGQLFEGKYKMQWAGQPLQKDAVSLALYTTLLNQLKPGTIFDLGTFGGGSALWFSAQATAMGLGATQVVTFDIADLRPETSKQKMAAAGNIAFVQGDLFDGANVLRAAMASGIDMPHPWLIAEDCHVDAAVIMAAFLGAGMQPGDYILFEDTHPLHIGDWRYWRESDGMFDLSLYKAAFSLPAGERPERIAEEKLDKVEETMGNFGDAFAVDTGIQDMFGYNGATYVNSVFVMVKELKEEE